MTVFKKFEDIEAWQSAREFTNQIYEVTSRKFFDKDFQLRNHLRKSACSILSNIAEGFERNGRKEFIQFLSIAKGSVGEVRSQLYVAYDQQYITEDDIKRMNEMAERIGRLLGGLMKYLKKSDYKGSKF